MKKKQFGTRHSRNSAAPDESEVSTKELHRLEDEYNRELADEFRRGEFSPLDPREGRALLLRARRVLRADVKHLARRGATGRSVRHKRCARARHPRRRAPRRVRRRNARSSRGSPDGPIPPPHTARGSGGRPAQAPKGSGDKTSEEPSALAVRRVCCRVGPRVSCG